MLAATGPHALLMSCAVRGTDGQADPATLALAGVLGQAFARHGTALLPLPGLDGAVTRRVMSARFPGADVLLGLDWAALRDATRPEPRFDEVEDLVGLLLDHADPAAGPPEDRVAVAHALACASLGDDHLWQDLHLPSRRELSALIGHWFPALAARNDGDMKWKRFFYKQLCERAELFICKAPSCGVCTDYGRCFGPEVAGAP